MASVTGTTAPPAGVAIQALGVKSSFIAAFEYDQNNLTLTTHLLNGSIYQHKFVTPLDWQALLTAQDHSKHWAQNIRGKKLSVRVKSAKAPRSEIKRKKGR